MITEKLLTDLGFLLNEEGVYQRSVSNLSSFLTVRAMEDGNWVIREDPYSKARLREVCRTGSDLCELFFRWGWELGRDRMRDQIWIP